MPFDIDFGPLKVAFLNQNKSLSCFPCLSLSLLPYLIFSLLTANLLRSHKQDQNTKLFRECNAPAQRRRFDFIVVSLSLVALGPLNVPVAVIRSMRALRIARLFRRIPVRRYSHRNA